MVNFPTINTNVTPRANVLPPPVASSSAAPAAAAATTTLPVRPPESGAVRNRLSTMMRKAEQSPTLGRLLRAAQRGGATRLGQDVEQRNTAIRAERDTRGAEFEDSPAAQQIRTALSEVKSNKDGKVLMFGYSPTGGGHTGRTLNILEESLKNKEFKEGDVVIAHVPSKWNGKERPAQLASLAKSFSDIGATVLLVEAEKSIHGFLKDDGSSDDPAILNRINLMPKRADADLITVAQAKVFSGAGDLAKLQSIDANHLVDSVYEMLGAENMHKVVVLTDMDPALQKAAARFGVPDDNRVDQQNHPILLALDEGKQADNLQPHMGVLGKVLGGHGEQIAYIGLGEKNTLQKMTATADRLGLSAHSTKQEALHAASGFLLEHGQRFEASTLPDGPAGEGILVHDAIKDAAQVKNMVYVYANDNQAEIARHVDERIKDNDPNYSDTLFVFCGKDAVARSGAPANALHMAYLADADGITTAGAGTVGEFCYLHKAGQAGGKFMAIPIEGHNEQEANAHYLSTDPSVSQYVQVAEKLSETPLPLWIRTFMSECQENAAEKYDGKTLKGVLDAVGDRDTYPAHGAALLSGREAPTAQEQTIHGIEVQMNDSLILSANRHFQKLVFQATADIEAGIRADATTPTTPTAGKARTLLRRLSNASASGTPSAIEVKLRKADKPKSFKDAKEFKNFLGSSKLDNYLGDGQAVNPSNIDLLAKTRAVFSFIAAGTYQGQQAIEKMNELKEQFGHHTTTGF